MPKPKKTLQVTRPQDWREFERLAFERLKELQKTLLPEYANDIVAIEPYSGGYVVAKTADEAVKKFWWRFPSKLMFLIMFLIRADGGPTMKLRYK